MLLGISEIKCQDWCDTIPSSRKGKCQFSSVYVYSADDRSLGIVDVPFCHKHEASAECIDKIWGDISNTMKLLSLMLEGETNGKT